MENGESIHRSCGHQLRGTHQHRRRLRTSGIDNQRRIGGQVRSNVAASSGTDELRRCGNARGSVSGPLPLGSSVAQ